MLQCLPMVMDARCACVSVLSMVLGDNASLDQSYDVLLHPKESKPKKENDSNVQSKRENFIHHLSGALNKHLVALLETRPEGNQDQRAVSETQERAISII